MNTRTARHLVQEGLPAEAAFEQDPGGVGGGNLSIETREGRMQAGKAKVQRP